MNYSHSLKKLTTLVLAVIATSAYAQKENLETVADFHHIAAYLVAALLIGVFVMIFSNRIYYYREKEERTRVRQMNTQLGLVIGSNNVEIWTFDIPKNIYTRLLDQGEKGKEYTPLDFSLFYQHDDFKEMRQKVLFDIRDRKRDSGTMLVRSAETDGERKIYEMTVSVLHRHTDGRPRVLLGIQRDVTKEDKRKEKARRLSMQFQTVFNSSLIDMIFYNGDGFLVDINDKACETFGIIDREAMLKRGVRITDIPSYRDIDLDDITSTQLSSITDIDKVKDTDERIPEMTVHGKMYYEVSLTVIRDKDGNKLGIIAAGRSINDMVLSHKQQQEKSKLILKTSNDIQEYIENINYTLRISGVRMINYSPSTHMLEISSDLNKTEYSLSQIRCASLIAEHDRKTMRGLFMRMDRRKKKAFVATLETIFHDDKGRSIFQTFNMVPVTDKDGNVTNYFGMARNDTEMHYTEAKLEEETMKAQETEELKNTFLKNMSYEIRTPLNAVLGFAQLFNGPHDEEDESVFAEEIKRNTGNLLALVNDILFISRLDAKMVEFNYSETDFATLFEGYCYMGWSTLNPGVAVTVDNPYNHLMVRIDEQNLGKVISKICNHTANVTTEGSIRAKCEYRHGELNITVEDTSDGISKEELKHVFDRFALNERDNRNGTGLDLPIIKEIMEQMGGNIEIQSEKGKGTSIYLILPCEMTSMEKKTEMVI